MVEIGQQRVVADVNHDGLADVVFTNQHDLYVLINNGNGTYQPPRVRHLAGLFGNIALGDVVGNGSSDLVSVGLRRDYPAPAEYYIRVLAFDPSRSDGFQVLSRRRLDSAVRTILIGTFAPGGRNQIVLLGSTDVGSTSMIVLSLVEGQLTNSGVPGATRVTAPTRVFNGIVHAVAAADLDGTGLQELIASVWHESSARSVLVRIAASPGAWHLRPVAPLPGPLSTRSLSLADFDGDGKLDIIVATARLRNLYTDPPAIAQVTVLRRTSTGGWDAPRDIGSNIHIPEDDAPDYNIASNRFDLLGVGDFDGDGHMDVLIQRAYSGSHYDNSPDRSLVTERTELIFVSGDPAGTPQRTIWNAYSQWTDPFGRIGAIPTFVGLGRLQNGATGLGLIGVSASQPTEVVAFWSVSDLVAT